MVDSITSAMPHIQSRKLRAIAVTTVRRSAALPAVPAIAEAGLPGYQLSPWFAVYLPSGAPPAIMAKLNGALLDAMKTPEARALRLDRRRAGRQHAEAVGDPPAGGDVEVVRNHPGPKNPSPNDRDTL